MRTLKKLLQTLEKSATNGPKDILEDLKINAFNSLLKIDLENQKSNEEILNIKTLQTKLITEVKKEAISTEKRLKKILSPLSRTQGRVTYRVNYFDRKFEEKLKASSPEDAKKTRWTKGRAKKIDQSLSELFNLFKSLQGQKLNEKELIAIQREFIAAFDVLNNYAKGKYNLRNPEFKKLIAFSGRIRSEGKLFRLSLAKRLDEIRNPLEAARKVIKSKNLESYIQRYAHNVAVSAPENHKIVSQNKERLELLNYLDKRKKDETKKLVSALKAQVKSTATTKKNLQTLISKSISDHQLETKRKLADTKEQKTTEKSVSMDKVISPLERSAISSETSLDSLEVKTDETNQLLDNHTGFLGKLINIGVGNSMADVSVGTDPTTPWWPPVQEVVFNAYFVFTPNVSNSLEVIFTNYSHTTTSFNRCKWSFGDGNHLDNSGSTSPTHTYATPGTYRVKLSMQSGGGWKFYETDVYVSDENTGGTSIQDDVYELWVRAFPDQIAIHAHNELLTEKEAKSGETFWSVIWMHSGKKELELSAWRSVVKKHGPQRAAWIVKALTPVNLRHRPTKTIMGNNLTMVGLSENEAEKGNQLWKSINDTNGDLKSQETIWKKFQDDVSEERAMEIAYTSLETERTTKIINSDISTVTSDDFLTESNTPHFPVLTYSEKQWSRGNESRVMPHNLLFAAYRRNGLDPYLQYGNTIPSPLPTGLSPNEQEAFTWDTNGNLIVSGAIKWMVDFEEAINVGMAVRIPVTVEEADPTNVDSGFEKIIVVGARDQETNTEAKLSLENLFENHHYSGNGLGFLPQGTATNNTGTASSGYSPDEQTAETSFEVERKPSKTAKSLSQLSGKKVLQRTDGDFIAQQLQINPIVFNNISGADDSEVADAAGMNQALWGGTLGSYFEDILYANDPTFKSLMNQDTIDKAREFFINNVKARGSFPILRVKNQPYGILPMMNFRKETERDINSLGSDFDSLLEDVLVHRLWKGYVLGQEWKDQDATGNNIYPPSQFYPTDSTVNGWWSNIIQNKIKNVNDAVDGVDPLLEYQKRFVNLLGLLPGSDELFLRNGVGIQASGQNFSSVMPNAIHTDSGVQFSYSSISDRVFNFYEQFYDISNYKEMYLSTTGAENGYQKIVQLAASTQLSKLIYAAKDTQLTNLIDDKVSNRTRLLDNIHSGKNYLNLLSEKTFDQMVSDIKNGQESSHSILHLLSRKSLMHGYWDSAARIWEQNTLVDKLYSRHFTTHSFAATIQSSPDPLTWLASETYLINTNSHSMPWQDNPPTFSGSLNSNQITEILTIMWNICLHNSWTLEDLCNWDSTLDYQHQPMPLGHNPHLWKEWEVKGIIRAYLIDWAAVENKVGVIESIGPKGQIYITKLPIGVEAFMVEYIQEQLTLLHGINPKDFLRGIFTRGKYKSFVTDMNSTGVFSPSLDFSSMSSPSNNWMDFFENSTFANKLTFLEENRTFTGKTDGRKMHEYLSDIIKQPFSGQTIGITPHFQQLKETYTAIDYLSTRPTEQLERALMEHIDLCSYRLDSWITGLANKKLDDLRDLPNYTTRIGAYGWVENLKPGGTRKDVNGNPITTHLDHLNEATPALDPENQGYIHAPTANHAAAAAILRSAYVQTEADVFQVNLSSQRVRKAKKFIDGVRGGIPLSELLGYEFERCLHDIDPSLSIYFDSLRQAFPIIANQLNDAGSSTPVNQVAARNMINGLSLLEAKRAGTESGEDVYPYGIDTLPISNSTVINQFKNALDKIEDTLDGLGDLAIAETVYQAASGNFDRSGAMAKALNNGTTIPEPEVITTPKHRHAISLRSGIILSTAGLNSSSPWASIPLTAKAKAEPSLNAWLSDQIGDPTDIDIFYSFTGLDSDNNDVTIEGTLSLNELRLHAIDLLPILGELIRGGSSELHQRIDLYVRMQNINASIKNLNISFTEKDPLAPANKKCLAEILPLCSELFKMVGSSNPMEASDLALTNSIPPSSLEGELVGTDFIELESRLNTANAELSALNINLTTLIASKNLDFDALKTVLFQVAEYGIAEALPMNATGITEADAGRLKTLVELVQTLIEKRLKEYLSIMNEANLVSAINAPDKKMDSLKKACEALFGTNYYLLPHFKSYTGKDVNYAVTNSSNILPADPLAIDKWMHGIGKVRSKMNVLENLVLIQELDEIDIDFTPIQLPHKADDQWLGLPYDPNQINIREDKLALHLSLPVGFDAMNNVYCGLLVDNWTEQITVEEEDTAIAFHYDQPNAKAAQSILLGVHSTSGSGSWDYGEMLSIVESASDMAQLRAVEPEQLAGEGSVLSLILPGVMDKITNDFTDISTDFSINKVPANPFIPKGKDSIVEDSITDTIKVKN